MLEGGVRCACIELGVLYFHSMSSHVEKFMFCTKVLVVESSPSHSLVRDSELTYDIATYYQFIMM